MMAVTDFSIDAFLGRGAEFLLLLLFGALAYAGFAYSKVRGGLVPVILGCGALAGLAGGALTFGGTLVLEFLRASDPPSETPGGPLAYETWDLLASLAVLLEGGALLASGAALVYLGWLEGQVGRRRPATKKSASRSRRV